MIPLPFDIPVDPAPPEATRWLVDELGKPEYQQAKPTLVDIVGQALAEWFDAVFSGSSGTPPVLAFAIGLVVVAAIIVLGVVFGGRVRLDRRSTVGGELFGADERRSARELRAAAAAAARRGDWASATADAYRAIARTAAEREVVAVVPGLTAHGFAIRAGAALPAESDALARAADAFDAVRYLGSSGAEGAYREVAALDARLLDARPAGLERSGLGA